MNYLHSKQAGNYGDVIKHLIHLAILRSVTSNLNQSEVTPPLAVQYLETHAGAGAYSLTENGKHLNGIGKLFACYTDRSNTQLCDNSGNHYAHTLVQAYLSIVNSFNAQNHLQNYPGSPLFAQKLLLSESSLSSESQLFLCEISKPIIQQLKNNFANHNPIELFLGDGYQACLTQLNPNKQNYLLIDPPYSDSADFSLALQTAQSALAISPNSIIAIWYPITLKARHNLFIEQLALSTKNTINFEYQQTLKTENSEKMFGCGMLLINCPQQAKVEIEQCWEELITWLNC